MGFLFLSLFFLCHTCGKRTKKHNATLFTSIVSAAHEVDIDDDALFINDLLHLSLDGFSCAEAAAIIELSARYDRGEFNAATTK